MKLTKIKPQSIRPQRPRQDHQQRQKRKYSFIIGGLVALLIVLVIGLAGIVYYQYKEAQSKLMYAIPTACSEVNEAQSPWADWTGKRTGAYVDRQGNAYAYEVQEGVFYSYQKRFGHTQWDYVSTYQITDMPAFRSTVVEMQLHVSPMRIRQTLICK